MHETNTFSRVPTDMDMVRRRDYHLENEFPPRFAARVRPLAQPSRRPTSSAGHWFNPVSANPNPSGIVTDAARTAALSRGGPHKGDTSVRSRPYCGGG